MRYVNLCMPRRIDGATPLRPLLEAEYDELVARHGRERVDSMYVREDDPLIGRIRAVAEAYADDPLLCQSLMRRVRRAPEDGGFDTAAFQVVEAESRARAAADETNPDAPAPSPSVSTDVPDEED